MATFWPKPIHIDAKDAASGLMVHVKIHRMRQWKARVTIAKWLCRLAAWVMWANIEIEDAD